MTTIGRSAAVAARAGDLAVLGVLIVAPVSTDLPQPVGPSAVDPVTARADRGETA